MTGTALILGASGKIGRHSLIAFEAAGWRVKAFDRSEDIMTDAARGCDLIVNGLNPPKYHNWKKIIPQITRDVIEAARSSGATVLLPGNVYHFGDQPGVWSEKTKPNPVSRKGKIRLEMERAYADSGVQTLILRAGNFIDPARQGDVMTDVYLRDIENDRVALPGPVETRQASCFLPDWARAAVEIAEMRQRLSSFEDIPFPGHTLSALDIKESLERVLQRQIKFTPFPWTLLKLLSPFWEQGREVCEMRYLWNTDHALCDQRFHQLLPHFKMTPLDEVIRAALPKSVLALSRVPRENYAY